MDDFNVNVLYLDKINCYNVIVCNLVNRVFYGLKPHQILFYDIIVVDGKLEKNKPNFELRINKSMDLIEIIEHINKNARG